jgi:protein-L-isoaspartate O-methyltransferase
MNKTYEELKELIESLGVHDQLGPTGKGWGIEHNPHELATFLADLPEIRTVLEIGTGYKAGLARLMTEHFGWDVTTIDVNHPVVAAPLARQIIGKSIDVTGKAYGKYDLVIIDGDHSYDAVKQDAKLYASMGKIVAYHDIAGLRACEGAAQYWKEISKTKSGRMRKHHKECVADGDTRAGIGWVVNAR